MQVVGTGHDPGCVVGQAQDLQSLLRLEIAERALRQVLAEVRGVGTRTAIADDEHEAAFIIRLLDQLADVLDLGRIEFLNLVTDTREVIRNPQCRTKHRCARLSSFRIDRRFRRPDSRGSTSSLPKQRLDDHGLLPQVNNPPLGADPSPGANDPRAESSMADEAIRRRRSPRFPRRPLRPDPGRDGGQRHPFGTTPGRGRSSRRGS